MRNFVEVWSKVLESLQCGIGYEEFCCLRVIDIGGACVAE